MMTLKELKKKYMKEGYKLAKKHMLLDSDQWEKDYDRRIEIEDADSDDIDFYDKIEEAVIDHIFMTLYHDNKAKDESLLNELFAGKSVDEIFSTIIPDVYYVAEYIIEDTIEPLIGYGVDYDDFNLEDIADVITKIGMDFAKQLSTGKVPYQIGNRYLKKGRFFA